MLPLETMFMSMVRSATGDHVGISGLLCGCKSPFGVTSATVEPQQVCKFQSRGIWIKNVM